jgi:hypothetical protein
MPICMPRLMKAFRWGLAPAFVVAPLIGCDGSSGPSASPPPAGDKALASPPEKAKPTPEQKRKGAGRAAGGATPSSAE